ncbi:hypothetical protein TSUD_197280 [Trifolium subterraneum]|uniref:YDG domain-containing protein n=1 Tax=Trifolium subterraneum TaxID=3900 RepID=A0A2Z6M195_TRISU|nr:hypothetical protein TSUD_197280 [Trifolium subterraneum]
MEDPARALLNQFIFRFHGNGNHNRAFDLTTQDLPAEFAVVEARSQLQGNISPIEIGEQFRYRHQLQLAGLHNHHIRGICHNGDIATCIVARYLRYNYFDEVDNEIVVGGEGGYIALANQLFDRRLLADQILSEGNLCMYEYYILQQHTRLVSYCQIELGGNNIENSLMGYEYMGIFFCISYPCSTDG